MFYLYSSLRVLWCHVLYLSHFEIIFVHGVRMCSKFIGLHVAVQLSYNHLLKRLSFLYCIFLPPLLKINWLYFLYFWALFSVLTDHTSVFVPVPCSFDYYSFVVLSEIWEDYTFCLPFSSRLSWQQLPLLIEHGIPFF